MSQHDYSIANQGFPATRADINNALSAIATNNSGTSAPSTQYAGQFWIDTTTSTWTMYIHDGTDDIQFATIDTSTNTVNFIDSALASDVVINTSGAITTTGAFTSVGIDDNATSTAITIDSSENVGIGTASPAEKLEVYGTEASGGVELLLTNVGDGGATTTPYTAIRSRLNPSRNGGEIRFGRDSTYGSAGTADSNLQFYTALDDVNTERMRINSSGRVMIGTTTEGYSSADDLTIATTGHTGITIRSSAAHEGAIYFSDATSGTGEYAGYMQYIHSNDSLILASNAAERMRINSSGAMLLGTTTAGSASTGDLVVNGGVFLGGSAAANELDDYEEGTWTPQVTASSGGTPTYQTQTGHYTKIGNVVTLVASLTFEKNTLSGTIQLTNFPFTSANHTQGSTLTWARNFATSFTPSLIIEGNATLATIYKLSTGTNAVVVTDSDLQTSGESSNDIRFQITYITT